MSATLTATPTAAATGVVLGFDFGTRRIGVAIGNLHTCTARALAVVEAPAAARWPRIAALIAEWQPDRLVVGVPRHPDGAGHEMTEAAERFARQLHGRFRLQVDPVDERYSTAVLPTGGTDADAAALILQQWIDATAAPASGCAAGQAPGGRA